MSYDQISVESRSALRPAYYPLAVVCILLAGFALRVWDLGKYSLWGDEVMTEYRVQAPLAASLQNILRTIDQTPLYYLALRIFPNGNEFLLRYPSSLVGVVGIGLMIGVTARLYHDARTALWAGTWLAFNPYHIWLSRTARAYSLMFLLSVLMSFLFLMLWHGYCSRRYWLAFILVSMAAYMTHYSLLAVAGTQSVLLALHWPQKKTFARHWFVAQVWAVVPMAIWFLTMLLNLSAREPQWGARPWLEDIVLSLRNMTVGYDGPLQWYTVPGLAVGIAGLTLAARTVNRRTITNLYWVVLLLAPILVVFFVSLFSVNVYVDRYFMGLFPGLVFLIAVGWASSTLRDWRIALAAVMVTGAVTVGLSIRHNTIRREDWRGVAEYVAQKYQPGDIFVVDRAVTMTAFMRYFDADQSPRMIQLSETDKVIPPDEIGVRYWVIYRSPFEDVHRLGRMPGFDPFGLNRTITSRWLMQRLPYVVDFREFDGVTIVIVVPQEPQAVSLPAPALPDSAAEVRFDTVFRSPHN